MVTVNDFKVRFPEFASVADLRLEMFIADAVIEMGDNVDRWIDEAFYTVTQAYLVAHLLSVGGGTGLGDEMAPTPISKTAADGVLVEFDTRLISKDTSASEFHSTSYGVRFVRYRQMAFAGGRVA